MITWLPVDLGPGVVAGFTTRFGGLSPPPWDSANLGLNVGDEPARVAANRRRLERALGAPVSFTNQVHGSAVHTASPIPVRALDPQRLYDADAQVTAVPGLGLGVLVADCVPVLLASAVAVATAHAGRRGVELGVVATAVAALRGLGSLEVRAAVGPAICGRCYEVPQAMQNEVCALEPLARATTAWGTPGLDLPAAVVAQLRAAAVSEITRVPHCTFTEPDFFSHRRAANSPRQITGRQAGIVLRRIPIV